MPPRSRALLGGGPWTGVGGALRAPRPAADQWQAGRRGSVAWERRTAHGRASSPLQNANTEDGTEVRGKRLSRGLKLRLIPGRWCRSAPKAPDQQRTSGRRGRRGSVSRERNTAYE
ncbi:hypothetical protein NDU88_002429 [Pleurodeles waltl]|uniref:Uncharacterized protein n=1 Tax=Pleurodeles waltl TaxID=8319 RepID=A0AAV7NH52_PLEWA|nr:hypothetical protein NDU88_002429 [Pleurodeles waltl]